MKRISPLTLKNRQIARAICSSNGWALQERAWLRSYAHYRALRGNPKHLTSAAILPNIDQDLKDLYDSPEGGTIATKVRHRLTIGSCPMCGSEHTGTVDHFLPRKHYPEFSIFGPNLIPACAVCNMFVKRTTFVGAGTNEHLLHPYYDVEVLNPLWQVRILRPLGGVRFEAMPLPTLLPDLQSRVQFHLNSVLGLEFEKFTEGLWLDLISAVAKVARGKGKTKVMARFLRNAAETQLVFASPNGNHNSWRSAFYRGVLADPGAVTFLAQQATLQL